VSNPASYEEARTRVTTAFNRLLEVPGASVVAVSFEREGVVVGVRRRSRRLVCPRCGCVGRGSYDRRRRRRWRHLDLGGVRCYLECELRRFGCPGCERVVTEAVPWARPAARFTRAFEDLVAWLARQTAFSVIGRLLRVTWRSVARIVTRVVGECRRGQRLRDLERIGVDDVGYRRGYRFLTVVADHDSGKVVWVGKGHSQQTLEGFFDQLGEAETAKLRVVSVDMWVPYRNALAERAPQARVCFDPFHVVQRANKAVETVRKQEWQNLRGAGGDARWLKQTRWSVLKRPERLSDQQAETLALLQRKNARLYRAYLLKEQLRAIYLAAPRDAERLLEAWIRWAGRSNLRPFATLSRTLRKNKDGVLAAIELGLSNSRLEALNARVRLINHRSYGFHSPDPLIALIYLCCGPITIELPT
jgi:transposase